MASGNLIQLISEPTPHLPPPSRPCCAAEKRVFEKLRGCECFPAGGDEWAVWAVQGVWSLQTRGSPGWQSTHPVNSGAYVLRRGPQEAKIALTRHEHQSTKKAKQA